VKPWYFISIASELSLSLQTHPAYYLNNKEKANLHVEMMSYDQDK